MLFTANPVLGGLAKGVPRSERFVERIVMDRSFAKSSLAIWGAWGENGHLRTYAHKQWAW
jgi:hypothetical protein